MFVDGSHMMTGMWTEARTLDEKQGGDEKEGGDENRDKKET